MIPIDQKTILLVEDEAIIAMTERKTLEQAGYSVIVAYDGQTAIQNVDKSPDGRSVDLVLMDIDLGKGMDGTEAASAILENHDIPIVFLSSHTEMSVVKKTEDITSYGYIVKSSGTIVLLTSIKMAFRLFAARNELKTELMERRRTEEALRHAAQGRPPQGRPPSPAGTQPAPTATSVPRCSLTGTVSQLQLTLRRD